MKTPITGSTERRGIVSKRSLPESDHKNTPQTIAGGSPTHQITTTTSIIISNSQRKMKTCSSKNMVRHVSLLVLTLFLCSVQSLAQQQQQKPADKPWVRGYQSQRRYRSSSPYQYRTQYQQQRVNLQSHFLDDDNWMNNKKVRYWDVSLATRRPNRYSWTSRIITANIIAFGLQSLYPAFTQWGVKLSAPILRGEQLYRLLTPVFLHGGIYHLFTNMYSLNRVGASVERLFGPGRYLTSYLVAGVAGNVLSAMNSPNPALGASGAVFGVMASFYVFLSRHEWLLGEAGRNYSDAITQTLLLNIVLGAMNPMVDNWGHLGGAVGGAAMAYYFGPRLYLAELPLDGGRTVVDYPVVRLPRWIESIPETISNKMLRITRRMQVWRYRHDLPAKPWRPKGGGGSDGYIPPHRRQSAPNRSIKPKDF
jgi:membrane associated rhomboid family serine protease